MISLKFASLVILGIIICYVSADNSEYHDEFTREWAVKVHDPLMADLIALETGFENKGLVNSYFISFYEIALVTKTIL